MSKMFVTILDVGHSIGQSGVCPANLLGYVRNGLEASANSG